MKNPLTTIVCLDVVRGLFSKLTSGPVAEARVGLLAGVMAGLLAGSLVSNVSAQPQSTQAQTLSPAATYSAAVVPAWPAKPLRFVVPYPPGGPLDTMARLLAEKTKTSLGQSVIVENKPGAGGNIGADVVAKAPPMATPS